MELGAYAEAQPWGQASRSAVRSCRNAGGRGFRSAQLARTVERDYKNVHADVAALSEWLAIQRDEDGRVCVPWAEIIVDMKLPAQLAA